MEVQNAHDIFKTWTLEGFFYESTNISDGDDEMVGYKEKVTKAFVLLCDHFVNVQLTHIQYCEDVKSA
jgi:hypothetical protein